MTGILEKFIQLKKSSKLLMERLRDEIQGVAAIEFALLAPLMIVMYIGTIEIASAVSVNRKLSRATSIIGDIISRQNSDNGENGFCLPEAQIQAIMGTAPSILFPYNRTAISVVVTNIAIDSQRKPKVRWSETRNGTADAVGAAYDIPDEIRIADTFLLASKVSLNYESLVGWFNLDGEMSDELFFRARLSDEVTIC